MNTITDLPFGDDLVIPETTATTAKPKHWDTYPSILSHLAAEEYHRHPAVSKHGLDDFRKAPSFFKWCREHLQPASDALTFGSLYHTVMLEPDLIGQRYITVPREAPRRPTRIQRNAKKPSLETLEAIQWWDEFEIRGAGRTVVDHNDIQLCNQMRVAMLENTACRNALTELREFTEASLFWEDEKTGVKCRARPDIIRTDDLIVDPKTCRDATESAFMRAAYEFGYFRQAAMYLDGLEAATGRKGKAFIFLAQETEAPFLCKAYVASPQMIELGRAQIAEDLAMLAQCQKTDTWPGLGDKVSELNLPPWAMPKSI